MNQNEKWKRQPAELADIPTVVDFAYQIVDMDHKIKAQSREITRLLQIEKDFYQLLKDSREHGEKMIGNLLKVVMTPGVAEAFKKNGDPEDFAESSDVSDYNADYNKSHYD